MLTRRSILRGLIAAPAIVSIGSIMPVRLWKPMPVGAGIVTAQMIAAMSDHEFREFRINWGYYRQERGLPFALPFHGSNPWNPTNGYCPWTPGSVPASSLYS
jgi:hypothetical protein